MSLDRMGEVLRARWRWVLGVWLVVMAIAAAASMLLPAQYRATVSVMVEPRVPDPLLGLPSPIGMPSHIPTEIDVVQSERVALGALRALGLQNDAHWVERWKADTDGRGEFEPWLAAQLLRHLDVRPSRDSNVLTISFTAPEPQTAARVANAFTQAYIQNSADLRLEPARQYNAYFDQSAHRLRDAVEQAQAKLSAYQQQNGLVDTDQRLDVENLRLTELSSQVVALQAAAVQAAERRRQAELNGSGLEEVHRNPAVFALSADLAREERRLSEMTSRMGDQHPSVIEARASIRDLRRQLEAASQRASRGIGIESRMASDQLAQVQRALEQQRAKILALKARRDEAQVLQREVDNAQRAYDAVLTRSSQTAVEAGAARRNISVLKTATVPVEPRWPRLGVNVAASALIGLLLAAMAALWRESRDRRLRIADDVTELLGQSLLVVLPDSSTARRAPLLPSH